ncbi:MAG TPA: hypothetical protein VNZ57_05930 [Longimicrobiales bacterium]|nr:hypothetical protein [Longimicrobiales bacterium]
MSRTYITFAAAFILSITVSGRALAQAWDTPTFLPPRLTEEIGAGLIDPEGADWGLVGFWRQPGPVGFGVRAGFVTGGDATFLVGTEFFAPVFPITDREPLAMLWTAGLGGAFGDHTEIRIPVGVTAGVLVPMGAGLALQPYAHPRAALDLHIVDDETTAKFRASLDLGADLVVGSQLRLRFAGTFFEREAWGISASWTGLRPVDVVGR